MAAMVGILAINLMAVISLSIGSKISVPSFMKADKAPTTVICLFIINNPINYFDIPPTIMAIGWEPVLNPLKN